MIDAFGPQNIQRAAHIIRRPLLPGMRHSVQAQFGRARKHAGKFFRGIPALRRVQPHTDEIPTPGQDRLKRSQGVLFRQMAQEAHDPATAQPQFLLCALRRAHEPRHEHVKTDATVCMGLWIEKRLDPHHMVGRRTLKISPRQIKEILLGAQHAAPRVVQIQKGLQIGEGIRLPQRLHIGVWQLHPVALRQGKNQLGLQRPFDVHMQFGFGAIGNQLLQVGAVDGCKRIVIHLFFPLIGHAPKRLLSVFLPGQDPASGHQLHACQSPFDAPNMSLPWSFSRHRITENPRANRQTT